MVCDWDYANRDHIAEHDVTTDEAEYVLLNDPLDIDMQARDGEERLVQVGGPSRGRILVAVSVSRGCSFELSLRTMQRAEIVWRMKHGGKIFMAQKLEIPTFATEKEEARWWFTNREAMSDEFELAAKEGRLGVGTAVQRANAAAALVTLDPEDVARARVLAERRGLEYQAYVKMVVHEALLHEEQRA